MKRKEREQPAKPAAPVEADAPDLDRLIHEPVRLRALAILSGAGTADFTFLQKTLGLTNGNLSSHMDKLDKAGYVEVKKSFQGKMPLTTFTLTEIGRRALDKYWADLDAIRSLGSDE